jgi:hypothetical protein
LISALLQPRRFSAAAVQYFPNLWLAIAVPTFQALISRHMRPCGNIWFDVLLLNSEFSYSIAQIYKIFNGGFLRSDQGAFAWIPFLTNKKPGT